MSSQPSLGDARVLALIPAYNEEAHIAGVVTRARAYLPVLVVDDGSKDHSAERAEAAGADVLRQVPNQGKGAALHAGFRWALEHGYAAVIMLDADGQHDPDEIPRFLEAYAARGADLIIGEREFRRMPFPRNLSNTLGRWMFSWALGQTVRDNQSGYRLVSRRLMEAMLASVEQGFEFEVEMILIAVQRGYTLDAVPISTIYGDEVSHIRPGPHIANFFRVVRHTRRSMQAARRKQRPAGAPALVRWLPLLALPLIGIVVAGVILTRSGGDDPGPTAPAGASFPTPAPVTFIPPTPLPTVEPQPDALHDQPVPDFTLTLLDGEPLRLRDLEGQVVFLNFWATWCEPCKEEMPALQAMQDEHGGEVRVVTITDPQSGQTEEDIRAFLDTYDLSLDVALSSDLELYQTFGVLQIPTTFVIDRSGTVRYRHLGALHPEDLDAFLDELL